MRNARHPVLFTLLFWLLQFFPGAAAFAESKPQTQAAAICLGHRDIGREVVFGSVGVLHHTVVEDSCPAHTVFMSTVLNTGPERAGNRLPLAGNCCPVPKDFLTEEHHFVQEHCPDNHVVTGARQTRLPVLKGLGIGDARYWANRNPQEKHCTKINTERYQLAKPKAGILVGSHVHFSGMFSSATRRAQLPPALRFGLGRQAQYQWLKDFCVGRPWGALLTGVQSKKCDGYYFSEILKRTEDGLVPFTPYANCLATKEYSSENAGCIPKPLL